MMSMVTKIRAFHIHTSLSPTPCSRTGVFFDMAFEVSKQQQATRGRFPALSGLGRISVDVVLNEMILADRRVSVRLLNEDGTILMMNSYAARPHYSRTPEQLIGKDYAELMDSAWTREMMDYVHMCLENDKRVIFLLISEGHRVRSLLIPVREDPSDPQASAVLIMSEEICADVYEQIISNPEKNEIIAHSMHVDLGPRLNLLTKRELEVLALMRQGLRSKEIANELCRSESTILRHRESIGSKLEMHDRCEIIGLANAAVLQIEDAHRTRLKIEPGRVAS